MPRLSVYHATGRNCGWNEPIDYCRRCYPRPTFARATWGDDVDVDVEHPAYSDDAYDCETCGNTLTDRDN